MKAKLLGCSWLVWLFSFKLIAQTTGQACFTTDVRQGCFPLTVNVTNCSSITTDPRLMLYDFGEDKPAQNTTSYTYTKAGKYFITQYINVGNGAKTDGKYMIEVFAPETPQFAVEYCGNYTINIKIKSNGLPRYVIDYGEVNFKTDTVVGLSSTSFTYADSRPRIITVTGVMSTSATACGSSSQTITPLRRLPAADFQQVKVLENNQVELQFIQNSPYGYKVSELTTTTTTTQTIGLSSTTQTSLVLTNRNTDFDTYLYRINPINCQGQDDQSTLSIGTVRLKVLALPQKNILTWTTLLSAGFEQYEVYRDNQLLATLTDPNTVTYTDDKVKCNQKYIYRVEYVLQGRKSRSISANKTIVTDSYSAPATLTSWYVSSEPTFVKISWQFPNTSNVKEFLLEANGKQRVIPAQSPFTDNTLDPNKAITCYRLAYIDDCGNQSAWTNTFCNLLLFVKDTANTVSFVSPNAPFDAVVEQIGNNNQVVATYSLKSILDKNDIIDQITRYRIKTMQNGYTVYSNIATATLSSSFVLPTAFSPNGDGLNDIFLPTARFINSYRMVILSQWGDIVFETTDLKSGWKGTNVMGIEVPTGVYAYQLEYLDYTGQVSKQNGIITLIR